MTTGRLSLHASPGYRIQGERLPGASDHLHLPNAPGLAAGSSLTLCGWTDVEYRAEDGAVDCPLCLAIVAYCKGLRATRGAA